MSSLTPFLDQYGALLGEGLVDTMVMLFASTAISYVIGIFLGVVLCVTAPRGLHPMRTLNAVLGWVVNIGRSIPFIILLVSMFPVTRALQSLAEVPRDSIEAAEACGASIPRIVVSALLPEALPSIVRGVSITLIAVLGYTAIAGAVGAGGLGDIAIRYGYYRYQDEVMIATLVLIVILVQVIQSTCDAIAKKIDHR